MTTGIFDEISLNSNGAAFFNISRSSHVHFSRMIPGIFNRSHCLGIAKKLLIDAAGGRHYQTFFAKRGAN